MNYFWFFMSRFLVGVIIGLLIGSLMFTPARAEGKPSEVTVAILEYSAAHNIDPLLVAAVIRVESKFDPKAVGSSGEIGLMQLHKRYFADVTFDIRDNISTGVRYLAYVRKHCPSQANLTWIACYNSGTSRKPKYPHLNPYYKKVMREYGALKKARRS